MSHSGPTSSPLSSPPSSPPGHVSPIDQTPPAQVSVEGTPQPDEGPASPSSPVQSQQLLASESVSETAHTSNVDAKRAPKQSPKSARSDRDDDSESDAFGTPPPKRPTVQKTVTKKATENPAPKKPAVKRTATKKAATTPPTRARPSRNRKAPDRFEDTQEKPKPKPTPAKKGTSKVFDPVFITTNSTSRLVKADVYHMLLQESAWTSLSPEQQTTLISMLPQDATNKALLAKISAGETEGTRPPAFTLSNTCFRTDVAKFQDDLRNGHLAKRWQTEAEQAVAARATGEFDAWKAEEAELWWGQKSK